MVNWKEYFYYKDGKLYNIKTRHYKAKKDKEAGTTDFYGYRVVTLNGKRYKAHRVIWEMFNGPLQDTLQIDHVDRNPRNNKITNLRAVVQRENTKNQRKRKNNKSGITGVSWDKKSNKWRVQVSAKDCRKYLGVFEDLEFAELVAIEAREKYGYHSNHGT